jgi:aerotaxis receptor
MRADASPVDRERPFGIDELFFSTTDRRGVILSGNDVFVRVSGYDLAGLIGKPHNIIRHPDMPRAVFHLLWDYLNRNAPFAGYVKNMAADGAYYWVLALVVPVKEGFLSVRFKPGSAFFTTVKDLYPQLLATEGAAGTDAEGRRRGMEEAGAQLATALKGLGFASYDHFMQAVLAGELSERAARRRSAARREPQRGDEGAEWLDDLLEACEEVDTRLGALFANVEDFLGGVKTLDGKATFLLDLSLNVHLVALNALISSCRVGGEGSQGLAAVAQNLATQSHDSMQTIDEMTGQLHVLTSALRDIAFNVSAATLQVEMTAFFLHELRGAAATSGRAARDAGRIVALAQSIADSSALLAKALPKAQNAVPLLSRLQDRLTADLQRLSYLHILGKIQAGSVDSGGDFLELLERVSSQLTAATENRRELQEGIEGVRDRLPPFSRAVEGARRPVEQFRRLAADIR